MGKIKQFYVLAVSIVLAVGLIAGAIGMVNAAAGPDLKTDKATYALGAQVTITGSKFNANAVITLSMLNPDRTIESLETLLSDATGKFEATYTPRDVGRFTVTASDGKTTMSAVFNVFQSAGMVSYLEREAAAIRLKQSASDKAGGTKITTPTISHLAVLNNKSTTTGAAAVISGGGGTGAFATVSVISGTVSSVNLINGGSGYTSEPTVSISGGGGIGATAKATVTDGKITAITLTSGGYGYISPLVVISGGYGMKALARAEITNGAVTRIIIISGGSDYTEVPTISIIRGNGTGATAEAKIKDGTITEIKVTNGGSGYGGGVK